MKYALILALVSLFSFACSQNTTELEERIAVLEKKQYETFAKLNDLQGALDETSKALAELQIAVKEAEPKPVDVEEVFSHIFENAVRVDRFSRDDLKSCTAYSAYDIKEGDKVTVEVVFARVEDGAQYGAPRTIHLRYQRPSGNSINDEIEFSRQIDNPWNTPSSLPTLLYQGKLEIGTAMHDYQYAQYPSGLYPNRVAPGVAMVTFLDSEGIDGREFIEQPPGWANWSIGQPIPQKYLEKESECRLTETDTEGRLFIDNIVPDTFIVAWYVENEGSILPKAP